MPKKKPKPPTLKKWLSRDPAYLAERASLGGTRSNALADYRNQLLNYDLDFTTALKNLGRTGYKRDNTATKGKDEYKSGRWDANNQLGAYGQGLKGINNDFSSRGLLDSSFFGEGLTNFNTDMDNQLASLERSRQGYRSDNTVQVNAAETDYRNALKRAQADSAARAEVRYGKRLKNK
jgi:hypothetical protein